MNRAIFSTLNRTGLYPQAPLRAKVSIQVSKTNPIPAHPVFAYLALCYLVTPSYAIRQQSKRNAVGVVPLTASLWHNTMWQEAWKEKSIAAASKVPEWQPVIGPKKLANISLYLLKTFFRSRYALTG